MTTNAAAGARTPASSPSAPTMPQPDATADAPVPAQFPDFPPRADMMNTTYFHDDGNQAALRLHLGNPETTIVLGEVPIAWDVPAGRAGVRIPDLLVAFNIRRARVIAQKGYSIREQGKPPDFVLEVASDNTARRDEIRKREDYAAFGIAEYWLFDPDWGQRYEAGLTGWTLVNGNYEPIPIHQYAPGMYYGYSAVLGLYVCWEHGKLRWYDPDAGYLRTHDEEHSDRIAAETRHNAAETRRIVVELERDLERDARIAAEARLENAETQRDEAQAEIQRLQDEVARLQGEAGAS